MQVALPSPKTTCFKDTYLLSYVNSCSCVYHDGAFPWGAALHLHFTYSYVIMESSVVVPFYGLQFIFKFVMCSIGRREMCLFKILIIM